MCNACSCWHLSTQQERQLLRENSTCGYGDDELPGYNQLCAMLFDGNLVASCIPAQRCSWRRMQIIGQETSLKAKFTILC
jgi:hypothetical protein